MPWQRLRDWIDEQESWERKHGRPAHLSQNQVTAISSLVHVFEEPELDGADYISKLYGKAFFTLSTKDEWISCGAPFFLLKNNNEIS